VKGTLASNLADISETLDFARRGRCLCRIWSVFHTDPGTGKLCLNPTVVGLSRWNEAIQKLKNGEVAG
jgi:propanol-preferring alcohol dehydrogenase